MEKLRSRFGQTAPARIADEAFTATDKYLNGMCIFRKEITSEDSRTSNPAAMPWPTPPDSPRTLSGACISEIDEYGRKLAEYAGRAREDAVMLARHEVPGTMWQDPTIPEGRLTQKRSSSLRDSFFIVLMIPALACGLNSARP